MIFRTQVDHVKGDRMVSFFGVVDFDMVRLRVSVPHVFYNPSFQVQSQYDIGVGDRY